MASNRNSQRRRRRVRGLVIAAVIIVLIIIITVASGLSSVLSSNSLSLSSGLSSLASLAGSAETTESAESLETEESEESSMSSGSSRNSTDYAEFYGLTSEDAVMINYDNEVLNYTGLYIDGEVYLPYDMFHNYLNSRIYWDGTEQILRCVMPDGIVSTTTESAEYTYGSALNYAFYPIVHVVDDQMYISVTFLEQYTDMRYSFYKDPYRIVISDEWGETTLTRISKNTNVRELGGNRSNILTKISSNDFVIVLEEMEDWTKICTQDGFVGYVKNNALGDTETLTYTSTYVEPVYNHRLRNYQINMAWHQVTNQTANEQLYFVLESTSGINVISPTWFYLNDDEGGIESLASSDYVTYCHQHGIEVWALISNLENPDVDTTSVLNTTSTRDALIDNLMEEAVKYDLDGINVDFESLEGEAGTGFIEFIRELSLRCAENDMVLSVDNYPPAAYNTFYSRSEQAVFADYVVLMAYDEHYNGSDEGSVASISFVRQSVEDTLEEVPANQLILGIPFYTRLWQLTSTSDGYEVSSEALGMSEAQSRVLDNGSSFIWLDEVGQYYGEYESDGSTYELWLEDSTSVDLKLSVMQSNNLAGASFWRLGYESSDVWGIIANYLP